MSTALIDDLAPFIAGAATQLVGSIVQFGFLHRLRRATEGALVTQLLRDGDIVQLVCTTTAVVPSAAIVLRGRETFLLLTILIAIVLAVTSVVVLLLWDATEYRRYSRGPFTPACVFALLLCALGGVVAYAGHR